jgi:hypothetical protein
MPFKVIRATETVPNRERLLAALLDEWRRTEGEAGPDGAPEITVEEGARQFGVGRALRIKVVWDAWDAVQVEDRRALVVEVFQTAAMDADAKFRPEDMLRVTHMETLTHAEAR